MLLEIDGRFPLAVLHREYTGASPSPDERPAKEFAYAAGHLLLRLADTSDRAALRARLRGLGLPAPKPVGRSDLQLLSLNDSGIGSVDDTLRDIQADPLLAGQGIEPDFLLTTSEDLDAIHVVEAASGGPGLIDPVTQNWIRPTANPATYGPDVLAARADLLLANLPAAARVIQFEAPNAPNSFRPGTMLQNFWIRTLDTSIYSSVYIQSAYTAGYPLNGGNYVRVLGSDKGLEFTHKDGLPFQAHQVDLSEYSTVFTYPTSIIFTGVKADGSTVTQTFRTDGVIDGTGPAVDFQTFTFSANFENLVQLRATAPPYMIDNIVVTLAGQETPLPPPPAAPVAYEVNWDDALSTIDATPPVSGPYAISSINFGYPKVRASAGALSQRPLELIGGESVSYGQIRFDLGQMAERYVVEVDLLRTRAQNSLALFFDGDNGIVRIDFNSSTITVLGSSVSIPYQPGQVNRLRAELIPDGPRLILSLNGTTVLDVGTVSALDDVKAVRFSLTDSAITGGTFLDNLRIEAHAPATPPSSAPRIHTYPSETLTFPATALGGETVRSITITNPGTTDLVITSITGDNPAFVSGSAGIPTLPPGGLYYHNLVFHPLQTGETTGNLLIRSNAPDRSLTLTGTGVGVPSASVSPSLLDAHIIAGARGAESFEIRNHGSGPLSWRFARTDTTGLPPPSPLSTNDPSFASLWGLSVSENGGINATRAWRTNTGSASDLVAVIDTGVDLDHPDLVANLAINLNEIPGNGIDDDHNGYVDDVNGWNFVDDSNSPQDRHGHGTHVAGTIAASGNNHLGVVGVAWSSRVLPIQFLSASGVGYTSDAIQAVDYARVRGARLINASWGGGGYSSLLRSSIQTHASATRGLFIAAAGNDGRDVDASPFYPAGYGLPEIVAVAATAQDDTLAYFSNFGRSSVHVAAPGQSILSAYRDGGYAFLSGTSMAAPHVAGALALLQAQNPYLSGLDQKTLLIDHVDYAPALNGRVASDGRINVWRSLNRTMASWLSPTTTYGVVAPGGIATIGLDVDATNLSAGAYAATLAFQTNDPIRSLISLPVRLQVDPDTGFNHWTSRTFGRAELLHTGLNSAWAADADPDQDNLPNLLEYVLGRSATTPETTLPLDVRLDAANEPFVTFETLIAPAGAVWVVEWSSTLVAGSWTTSGILTEELSRDEVAGTRLLRARFPATSAVPERVFFRLRAQADK